jgi:hypothetical protein
VIDIDPQHPLTEFVSWESDTLIAKATPLMVPSGGKALIDSDKGTLLAITSREGFEDAVLGFPLRAVREDKEGKRDAPNTSWHTRRGFPVFVLNLVQYLGGGRAAQSEGSVRPGQRVVLDTPTPETRLEMKYPNGDTTRLGEGKSGKVAFTDTAKLGIYEAKADDKNIQRFAVNLFEPAESDIAVRSKIHIGDVPLAAATSAEVTRQEIWKLLLLSAVVLLALEWYIYNRRVSL